MNSRHDFWRKIMQNPKKDVRFVAKKLHISFNWVAWIPGRVTTIKDNNWWYCANESCGAKKYRFVRKFWFFVAFWKMEESAKHVPFFGLNKNCFVTLGVILLTHFPIRTINLSWWMLKSRTSEAVSHWTATKNAPKNANFVWVTVTLHLLWNCCVFEGSLQKVLNHFHRSLFSWWILAIYGTWKPNCFHFVWLNDGRFATGRNRRPNMPVVESIGKLPSVHGIQVEKRDNKNGKINSSDGLVLIVLLVVLVCCLLFLFVFFGLELIPGCRTLRWCLAEIVPI